jgi:hypothetical protein
LTIELDPTSNRATWRGGSPFAIILDWVNILSGNLLLIKCNSKVLAPDLLASLSFSLHQIWQRKKHWKTTINNNVE